MYHGLSPETAEFIDFMYENELLDVLSKDGKALEAVKVDQSGGASFPDILP